MLGKTILACLLVVGVSVVDAFPREFKGEWEDTRTADSGVMTITISEHHADVIKGLMYIRGSPYCVQPVSFQGKIVGHSATIESNEEVVCGYKGKLTGTVRRESDTLYVGDFQYVYWKIAWAKGTFRLVPPAPPETK